MPPPRLHERNSAGRSADRGHTAAHRTRVTARGASGAYLRVLETGEIGAGDDVEVLDRPDHGVTTGLAFRTFSTQKHRLPELAPALAHLPVKDQPRVAARIAAMGAERSVGRA